VAERTETIISLLDGIGGPVVGILSIIVHQLLKLRSRSKATSY
jgi:hypothetical protein